MSKNDIPNPGFPEDYWASLTDADKAREHEFVLIDERAEHDIERRDRALDILQAWHATLSDTDMAYDPQMTALTRAVLAVADLIPDAPDDLDELIAEDIRDTAEELRVYPAEDGQPTVDTCYLADDMISIRRRLERIRDGAWTAPALSTAITPDDLAKLAQAILALTQALAKPAKK